MAASSDPKVRAQSSLFFGLPRGLFLGSGCYIGERKDLFPGGICGGFQESDVPGVLPETLSRWACCLPPGYSLSGGLNIEAPATRPAVSTHPSGLVPLHVPDPVLQTRNNARRDGPSSRATVTATSLTVRPGWMPRDGVESSSHI